MVSDRPIAPDTLESPPKDDGLFGSGSVTWRVHAGPAMAVIGMAAAMYQMLRRRRRTRTTSPL